MNILFFILAALVFGFIVYKAIQMNKKGKVVEVKKGYTIVPEGNPQGEEEPHGPKEQL
jgi:hypothetical protein